MLLLVVVMVVVVVLSVSSSTSLSSEPRAVPHALRDARRTRPQLQQHEA
jgi:hypothetical protein